MYPPIFKVCSSSPAVTAILGASPLRMYQFGLAPPTRRQTVCNMADHIGVAGELPVGPP